MKFILIKLELLQLKLLKLIFWNVFVFNLFLELFFFIFCNLKFITYTIRKLLHEVPIKNRIQS